MLKLKCIFCLVIFYKANIVSAQISLIQFSSGYSKPLDIKNCGDDRLFIVEQTGRIWIADTAGVKLSTPFLDIHSIIQFAGEKGLLGLAFPPDFLTSGYFYVNYSEINTGNTHISRFHVDSLTPDSADANSEEIILKIYQPYPNHKGGHLAFGPDGYLYIGMGDGGNAPGNGGDRGNRAQNPDSLLGKFLRIEVDPAYPGYKIPTTNPFANDTTLGRAEIWALGVRNPWRWSFDSKNGDLWIGDVGQSLIEEIDRQPAGSKGGLNYGWHCFEGDSAFGNDTSCLSYQDYVAPVYVYKHTAGLCSVTGGYIYRGARYSELYAKYFFADYCVSQIQYLQANVNGGYTNTNLGSLGASNVSTFGVDRHGELYCTGLNSGIIYRFISADCSPVATINDGRDTVDDCGVGMIDLNVPSDSSFNYLWKFNGNIVSTSSHYVATQDGKYYIFVINGSCSNSDSVFVKLSSPLVLNISNLDSVYCVFDSSVNLIANYSPGIFSGPGINGESFNPSVAGIGNFIITYNYTSQIGCVSILNQPVRVDACDGVPEINWMKTISVYPVPSHDDFYVHAFVTQKKRINLEIRDVIGRTLLREIFAFSIGDNSFPIETTLAKGIYIVRVSDKQFFTSLKIIIQ